MANSNWTQVKTDSVLNRLSLYGWTTAVGVIALLICTPIIIVASSLFTDTRQLWQDLAATVLKDYILNSLALMIGVGFGVLLIGVGTAWLVTGCQFPGSSLFEWSLLLPLSAPAYLLAYTYTNMLDFFGPVQTLLRQIFGWSSVEDYWFPNIRSLWGAIIMLILVLYPYVYLLARVAFLEQSVCTLEASRSLGCGPWRSFFTVALPLARPAIMAGLALALMETLNDFGTVQYFGVNAFTTGIYNTWFGMGARVAAAQLAAFLMLFIFALIILERWSRRQAKYYQVSSRQHLFKKYQLKGFRGISAAVACFIPLALGFLAPAAYLLDMTLRNAETTLDENFVILAKNSLILAAISAALGLLLSLVMAYGQRLNANLLMVSAVRVTALGYAIPGIVIAVGVLIPIGQFDNTIDAWMKSTLGVSTQLLLSGTIFGLIFAYLVRFLAVALGAVESSLSKIKPSLDDASRSLGYGATSTLINIHLPLMSGGMLTAVMLVFVDVMKELPATLVLRPFNFDTLAVRVYQYASDERLTEAAAPALAIVLVGMIPVIFLSLRIARSRAYSEHEGSP
ncbi:ABC transporter permease [Gloeothece verrucosa]|uniref:Binding-protein-dependent transport systems inner membrane component n=1 Tax=Gloeothece verrucosa (strain PCC 7822) TaxID=497965 RepID=E0U932_GLOV7|nr:iron ABC transporter permease [Gloeothece verrucosa]ADN16171.1 binding-protein-dependent transport systems inner membrane component [Gloeothece verrucosa PCC 7822]